MALSILRPRGALRAALSTLAAAALVAAPVRATWSIVVVDHATGEVGIASATCIAGKLSEFVPVVRAGEGAAAAQSVVSSFAVKNEVWFALAQGKTPKKILELLVAQPQSSNKQYGVAAFSGPAVSWSGANTSLANPALAGSDGTLSYAIQGNILTGDEVVWAAEEALVRTDGDLGQKLMAAMEAARALGGDARCSCPQAAGSDCDAPPAGFDPDAGDASACAGFVFVARVGDKNKPCSMSEGCARGDYYLKIEVNDPFCEEDPMPPLQAQYAAWREALQGRPDAILSEVEVRGMPLVADGASRAVVRVTLRDVEDVALAAGGAAFELDVKGKRPPLAELAGALDHGDGTYTLELTSTKVGEQSVEIEVDDGLGPVVTLYPLLDVEIVEPGTVTAAAEGPAERQGWQRVAYTVHGGAAAAGRPAAVFLDDGSARALVAAGLLDGEGRLEGVLEAPADAELGWTVLLPGPQDRVSFTSPRLP